ncbi:MAG: 4Fe-4S binding protein [Clostridiaceae bacterium]|nr:4Fe-4S binding protein [Clostridiaceae bacterium]
MQCKKEGSAVSKIIFDLDLELCCSCGACAVACMDQNDTPDNQRAFRNVFEYEDRTSDEKFYCHYFSVSCMHCDDAPCVMACPTGCIQKDNETGLTLYDNSVCIGCRSCSMACPFSIPVFDKNGKMVKCDGCYERLKHGMEPACVRVCPTGALKCYREDEYEKASIRRSLTSITSLIKR